MASISSTDVSVTVEKLRALFLMLDPDKSSLSEADKVKHKEVWETFDYFVNCTRRIAVYYRINRPVSFGKQHASMLPRFIWLLRENVLTHQWPEALKLVKTLSYEFIGADNTICKVGLACLLQDKNRNSRLVEQFAKQIQALRRVDTVEVFLDYLLFLLGQSNIDVKQLVQELKQNTLYRSDVKNQKRTMAKTLFFAYQGLAMYAEWKLAIFKADHQEDEMEMISLLLTQGSDNQVTKHIAQNAAEYLVTVADIPGVWDIFIPRLIEIYEYYGKTEECLTILTSYRDRNKNNPNAHRYLYQFVCSHGGEVAVQIQCLQDIIRLDPCNILCLDLYHLKVQEDPAAVSLLFDFLDYSHCSGNEEVWETLADTLSNIESKEMKETLRECWKTRKDWWPDVIFKDHDSVSPAKYQSSQSTLLRNKQFVLKVLSRLDKYLKRKRGRTRDDSRSEIDSSPAPAAKRGKLCRDTEQSSQLG